MENSFIIRDLTKVDISQMANARREQEKENGNGATDEYLEWYKNILKKLFKEKRLIAVGAFKGDKLVSLACYNLINFGNEKMIPYLCAVWTDPKYRGMQLATKVNCKLTESMLKIKKHLQPRALLTLEGNETALHLYKKIGYKEVSGEMTFLGDVIAPDSINMSIKYKEVQKDSVNTSRVYIINEKPAMEIVYSPEQFFAHPTNLNGEMNRITAIRILNENLTSKTMNVFLQQFLSEHRFCKLNVSELIKKEKGLYRIFGTTKGDIQRVLGGFEEMNFRGIDGEVKKIKRSYGIMELDLSRDFDEFGDK